ncbi:electron transport complex subunit RsxG [Jeongeupia chitinilytica]|uniref:Ion-translocating oxidoreductase complex subunit G n=1 Tax=Jeongeupia chitinilytica TaxID=1041641 RepID=A0ABQ3H381_9NEIS|nr:electron transport complex subunit RsxG [Jeongeupia chitinilytica]GHD65359.1 electron transport complex subunit G [Jeongeupia chitinilytica]
MKRMVKSGVRGAATLAVFALVFTALMAGTYALTRDTVKKNELDAKVALLAQVLPAGSYDNALLDDAVVVPKAEATQLGNEAESRIYLAKKAGKPVGAVVEATAPDGYAGKIRLLIGVDTAGTVLGVRVVSHKETPGLGDYIDIAKSDWIDQFRGKRIGSDAQWKVRKDGGEFDSRAGATISPRAVVKAIHATLVYVDAHRLQLFGVRN